LDKYFGGLTPFHFVFNAQKVLLILDEMMTGNEISGTSKGFTLSSLTNLERNLTVNQ
jgi:hypothetical protein